MKYHLPKIRLLEAASFRSFPSTTTRYDGTWAIRMTAGHPAKRLNSVNPLDPDDRLDLENRVALAGERFRSFGRPLLFRLTPLAPEVLRKTLLEKGWRSFEESLVMMADLTPQTAAGAEDQLPMKDIGRWVDGYIELSQESSALKPGLAEIIGATEPETGLFMRHRDDDGKLVSVVRCVRDLRLAGVFDLVTCKAESRKGHARKVLSTALRWAHHHGARQAWLQVVADNRPARKLYEQAGFKEVYRYSYWKPPVGEAGEAEAGS
ncbi:GNAT family N-acetyltransferase [Salaquimonas pukyongi]|uniref:GNAT family N-acetyltransferase n=1 Tax=Salaquimonas pukyongi TaxID=2712698 RepID=UPI00096BB0D1|nr:GNAT family N-acetyltransferase [Salaquimonas pukyongi]